MIGSRSNNSDNSALSNMPYHPYRRRSSPLTVTASLLNPSLYNSHQLHSNHFHPHLSNPGLNNGNVFYTHWQCKESGQNLKRKNHHKSKMNIFHSNDRQPNQFCWKTAIFPFYQNIAGASDLGLSSLANNNFGYSNSFVHISLVRASFWNNIIILRATCMA